MAAKITSSFSANPADWEYRSWIYHAPTGVWRFARSAYVADHARVGNRVRLGNCNTPAGGPVWDQLGSSSGLCWAVGCGLTGWIESMFTGEAADTYVLDFGVSNSNDTYYDSGLAFEGVEVGGQPIPSVPEPSSLTLIGTVIGLLSVVVRSRRQKSAYVREQLSSASGHGAATLCRSFALARF